MTEQHPKVIPNNEIARWSLAISLCPLLPIPFVDFFLVPVFARRLFAPIVPPSKAYLFIQKGDSFCLGCLFSILLWPIVKLVKLFRFIVRFRAYLETFQYWFYKAQITRTAMENFPADYWEGPERTKQFATALDVFLRRSDMQSLFSRNLQELVGRQGMISTLRTLFWATELTEGTETLLVQDKQRFSPHFPTQTPEIQRWLDEQRQQSLGE